MANKRKQFTEEQRKDALQYLTDHPDLSMRQCAENLGIGYSTLNRFKAQAKNSSDGEPKFTGSGHYSNECEKENAQLRRQLRDAQEALKILKKAISILGN